MSAEVLFAFPCFNPKPEQWIKLIEYIKTIRSVTKVKIDFVVIDDGSKNWSDPPSGFESYFSLYKIPTNKGKGSVLKYGVNLLQNTHKVYAFTDFDLPFSFENVLGIVGSVLSGVDICIGDRSIHDPKYTQNTSDRLSRKVSHILFRLFVRTIVAGGVEDSQCGIKAYDASLIKHIIKISRLNGFLYDLEWIYIALRHKLSIRPWPIQVLNSHESSSLRSFGNFNMLMQLWILIISILKKRYDNDSLYEAIEHKREKIKTSTI